jgi:hypothetical protein
LAAAATPASTSEAATASARTRRLAKIWDVFDEVIRVVVQRSSRPEVRRCLRRRRLATTARSFHRFSLHRICLKHYTRNRNEGKKKPYLLVQKIQNRWRVLTNIHETLHDWNGK